MMSIHAPDDIDVSLEKQRPPFGVRDGLIVAAATIAYGALLHLWPRHVQGTSANTCIAESGRYFASRIVWWIPLLALPMVALVGGIVLRFRREKAPGHSGSSVLIALGLIMGIPLCGLVPWKMMPLGWCVRPGFITRTGFTGDGNGLGFISVKKVLRVERRGSQYLRLDIADPYNSARTHEAMQVVPDDTNEPDALRAAVLSEAEKAGLGRAPPPRPPWMQ
jgi:hypothetical protein